MNVLLAEAGKSSIVVHVLVRDMGLLHETSQVKRFQRAKVVMLTAEGDEIARRLDECASNFHHEDEEIYRSASGSDADAQALPSKSAANLTASSAPMMSAEVTLHSPRSGTDRFDSDADMNV